MTGPAFKAVPKILEELVLAMLKRPRLKKLLHYTNRHALGLSDLGHDETFALLGTKIRTIPKIDIQSEMEPVLLIQVDSIVPGASALVMTLSFDIIADYDFWQLDDFELRPYAIAAEIHALMESSRGTFLGLKQIPINERVGGITLQYQLGTDQT